MVSVENKTNETILQKEENETEEKETEETEETETEEKEENETEEKEHIYLSSGKNTNDIGIEDFDENESDDSVNEINLLLNPLSFTDNSDLHVVSIDGTPQFYVKDENTASKKMWDVTRLLSSRHIFDGYRTQFLKVSDNELHILGSYRFFLVAYDQILHRVSYTRVQECV